MEKMNLNIKQDDMKPMVCTECGGMYFKQVMAINKVSKFLTGGDKDTIIPIPVFRCDDCGAVPEEFQPIAK
jgi:uncharacterized Zn finger protein